jgi:hypothetical protein
MKKVIRLTETDLAKIIKRVIKEQSSVSNQSNSSVIAIYNEIVDAVEGFGTDTNKLLSAIIRLKDQNEFKYLLTLFKDKKTGYSDFFEMINEEFEFDNWKEAEFLISALKNINVFTIAFIPTNHFGAKIFKGNFKLVNYGYNNEIPETPETKKKMESCRTLWGKVLPNAIKWWRDWLLDPITKKKFLSNYSDNPNTANQYYYPKYFELLNRIKLNFYNNNMISVNGVKVEKDAFAFVIGSNGNIYVNCTFNINQVEIEETLIHEIQHMIYDIKPLNPNKKISSVFGKNDFGKKSKEQIKSEFLSNRSNKTKKYSPDIIAVSKKLNVDPWYIYYLKRKVNKEIANSDDPGYLCRETEKMSNIATIRRILGIKPGQNITFDMVKPYITRDKENTEFYWFLLCWAQRGFTDINKMLQNINQLALKQNNQSQQNNTPPTNPTA